MNRHTSWNLLTIGAGASRIVPGSLVSHWNKYQQGERWKDFEMNTRASTTCLGLLGSLVIRFQDESQGFTNAFGASRLTGVIGLSQAVAEH